MQQRRNQRAPYYLVFLQGARVISLTYWEFVRYKVVGHSGMRLSLPTLSNE